MIPPIVVRLLIPKRLRPYVDRLLAGFAFGLLSAILVALATAPLFSGVNYFGTVWFLVAPVLGVVIAWRTRTSR